MECLVRVRNQASFIAEGGPDTVAKDIAESIEYGTATTEKEWWKNNQRLLEIKNHVPLQDAIHVPDEFDVDWVVDVYLQDSDLQVDVFKNFASNLLLTWRGHVDNFPEDEDWERLAIQSQATFLQYLLTNTKFSDRTLRETISWWQKREADSED